VEIHRIMLCFQFFMTAYQGGYSLGCEPVDYSNNSLALRVRLFTSSLPP